MKTKMLLKCNDDLWGKVQNYKVCNGFKNSNDAVNKILKEKLDPENSLG